MPKTILKIDKFEGGINSNADPKDITANEVSDAIDCYFGKVGQVSNVGVAKKVESIGTFLDKSVTSGYGLGKFHSNRSASLGQGTYIYWDNYETTAGTNGLNSHFVITTGNFHPHPVINATLSTSGQSMLNYFGSGMLFDPEAARDEWGFRIHVGGTVGGTPDFSYPIDGESNGLSSSISVTDGNGSSTSVKYGIIEKNDSTGAAKKWFQLCPDIPSPYWNISNGAVDGITYYSTGYYYFMYTGFHLPFNDDKVGYTSNFADDNGLVWFDGAHPSLDSLQNRSPASGYGPIGQSNLLLGLAAMMNQHEWTTATPNGSSEAYTSLSVYIDPNAVSGSYAPSNKYIWLEFVGYGDEEATPVFPFSHETFVPVESIAGKESGDKDYNFLSIPQNLHTNHEANGVAGSQILNNLTNNNAVTDLMSEGWVDANGITYNTNFPHTTRRIMPGLASTQWASTIDLKISASAAASVDGETYTLSVTGPNIDSGTPFLGTCPHAGGGTDTVLEIIQDIHNDLEGTYGSDMVDDGDMGTAGSWTAATGWAVDSGGNDVATSSAGTNPVLSQSMTGETGWAVNTWFQIKLDVVLTSGTLYIDLGDNTGANKQSTTLSASNQIFYIKTPAAFSGELLRFYGGSFRGTIDNVSAKKVTAGIGGISVIATEQSTGNCRLTFSTTGVGQALNYSISPSITRGIAFKYKETPTEIITLIDDKSNLYISEILSDSSAGESFDVGGSWKSILNNDNSHNVITTIANDGGETRFTSAAHGFIDGDLVVIKGTANYDGVHVVKDKTTDTFDSIATYVAETATSSMTATKIEASENNISTLLWPDIGAKVQQYYDTGVLRISDTEFDNTNNNSSWVGYISKNSLFNQSGSGTSAVDIEGWKVKDQHKKFVATPTDWVDSRWDQSVQDYMSDILTSTQKTFFAGALDDADNLFDFEDNVSDGDANLVDADAAKGFTATNASFLMSSDRGVLQNTATAQGIVTLPLLTVAGQTYQVKFDLIANTTAQVNVSLGSSAAYNASNKVTTTTTATGITLDTAYTADDTTSFLALQLTTTTSGHNVTIDNLQVYQVGAEDSGKMKIKLYTATDSASTWSIDTYKFYLTAVFDDGSETLPSLTNTQGTNFYNGTDYSITTTDNQYFKLEVGVDPYDANGLYTFDERMSGFRIYFSRATDGHAMLYDFGTIDFKDGFIPGNRQGPTAWSALGSDNYDAQIATVELKTEWLGTQYEEYTGYSPDNKITGGVKWKTATVVNNRCFVGNVRYNDGSGMKTYPSRMLASPLGKLDTFPVPESIIDYVVNDGDEIVKLENFSDRLLQFKKNSLYIINISTMDEEFLEEEHRWKGVFSPNHVVWTPEGVIWSNSYSIYKYAGDEVVDLMTTTEGVHEGSRSISRSDWNTFFNNNSILIYEPLNNQIIVKRSVNQQANGGDIYLLDLDSGGWSFGKHRMVSGTGKQTNAVTLSDGSVYILNSKEGAAGKLVDWSDIASGGASYTDTSVS